MRKIIFTLMALVTTVCGIECYAQTVSGQVNGHDYVDLGLPSGTKWATYNVGATKPTEYGNFFAWGEVKPKDAYFESTNKWYDSDSKRYTKYNSEDGLTTLFPEDDAATTNWGNAWRMPTLEEADELIKGCTWNQVPNFKGSGVPVLIGISITNGNKICIPSAGSLYGSENDDVGYDGGFWAISLDKSSPKRAFSLNFMGSELGCSPEDRFYGKSIRAVVK